MWGLREEYYEIGEERYDFYRNYQEYDEPEKPKKQKNQEVGCFKKYRWNIFMGFATVLVLVALSKMDTQNYAVALGILSVAALVSLLRLKRS